MWKTFLIVLLCSIDTSDGFFRHSHTENKLIAFQHSESMMNEWKMIHFGNTDLLNLESDYGKGMNQFRESTFEIKRNINQGSLRKKRDSSDINRKNLQQRGETTNKTHFTQFGDSRSGRENLNSCKNSCSEYHTDSCSCLSTCKVYGNCCHDFDEFCLPAPQRSSGLYNESENSKFICSGNHLLLASCNKSYDEVWWRNRLTEIDAGHLWFKFTQYNTSFESLKTRCESNASTDIFDNAPITHFDSDILYKNAFCAICNNILSFELWDGYLKCPPSSTKKSASDLNNTIGLLPRSYCQIFWWPRKGIPRSCSSETQFNTQGGNVCTLRLCDSTQSAVTVRSPTQENVDILRVTRNRRRLEMMCEQLMSFIKLKLDLKPIDESHFCYQILITMNPLLRGRTSSHEIKKSKDENVDDKDSFSRSNVNTVNNERMSDDVNIRLQGYSATELKCSQENELYFEEQCLGIAFSVISVRNFTFLPTRTRKYKTRQREQVENFCNTTLNVFEAEISNTTLCRIQTSKISKRDNPQEWMSHILLKCAEILPTDYSSLDDLSENETFCKSSGFQRYLTFFMERTNLLNKIPGLITMPVKIDTLDCIQSPHKQACCSTSSMSWVFAPVQSGNLALEALLTIICCCLSILGLTCRLVLQTVIPIYKTYPGKIHFCLCLAMLSSYCLLLIGDTDPGSIKCIVVAVLTHLAFLSSFFWMNVTAFENSRTCWSANPQSTTKITTTRLLLVGLYAVGLPVVIVVCALLMWRLLPDSVYSPSYGEPRCWLNGPKALIVFFIIPCFLICFVNVFFVGFSCWVVCRHRPSRRIRVWTGVANVLKVVALSGITWLLGPLAAVVDHSVVWMLFTVCNASLGLVVSAVLVFDTQVLSALRTGCQCSKLKTIDPKPKVETEIQAISL